MRQFQESIRPKVGIPSGLGSNYDLWYLVQVYNGSDCDKFENTSEHGREYRVHLGATGSADHKSGSTWKCRQQPSKSWWQVWEHLKLQ